MDVAGVHGAEIFPEWARHVALGAGGLPTSEPIEVILVLEEFAERARRPRRSREVIEAVVRFVALRHDGVGHVLSHSWPPFSSASRLHVSQASRRSLLVRPQRVIKSGEDMAAPGRSASSLRYSRSITMKFLRIGAGTARQCLAQM